MAEISRDRIHVQIEEIYTMELLASLKPEMTLKEYIELKKGLLERLKQER